jgi:hypothetical protein
MNDSRQALGSGLAPGIQIEEPVPPGPQATRLAVRLWPHARTNLKWSSELSVVYLLADLALASNGSLVNDAPQGLIAHFDKPADAYRAAKRFQWALLEFCQQRPDLCLGAAMVLYEASDLSEKNGDSDSRQVAALLERCRPAQVLVSGKTGSHLQDLPGLQFRPLNSGSRSRGEWQGGAQEALWTTTSNLEQIQQRLKEIAQNLVLQQESVQPEPVAAPAPIPVSDHPTLDFANAGGYRSDPTLVQNEPPPPPFEVEKIEPVSVSELLEDDVKPSGSRYLWLAVAAVVIIGALVYLLFPKPQPKQAVSDTPAPTSVSQQQEPVSPTEPPVIAQPAKDTPPLIPKPPDVPKPVVHHPTVEQPSQKQPKKVSEYEGMTEKDIPLLLRKAEKDAGAGNYDDAKREFDIVLHLDPGNAEARQGMRKLELSEREAR